MFYTPEPYRCSDRVSETEETSLQRPARGPPMAKRCRQNLSERELAKASSLSISFFFRGTLYSYLFLIPVCQRASKESKRKETTGGKKEIKESGRVGESVGCRDMHNNEDAVNSRWVNGLLNDSLAASAVA